MLTKCIGIISYFPDDEPLRTHRKEKFKRLINTLDTFFKLPIIIIAQNWDDEDLNIVYCNTIIVYKYNSMLGVTGARIALRDKFLQSDYDYIILLDDDSNITCTESGVISYFKQIDAHPNMMGLFKNRAWHRLLAISKSMYQLMNYDFIKNYESIRGEIWEDAAFVNTYKRVYPNKVFQINVTGLDEKQLKSEEDPDTTWYKPEFDNKVRMNRITNEITKRWINSLL